MSDKEKKEAKPILEIDFSPELVTMDEMIFIQEGHLSTMREVLGRMVVAPGGGYMKPDKGAAMIGKLTLSQIMALSENLREQMSLPKLRGKASEAA